MSVVFNTAEIEQLLRVYQHDISPNESRTSLFNLVVYTAAKDTNSLSEAINQLMGKRPCRVIIVQIGDKGASSVHVSARCVEDTERKQVCIQEIIISSGEDKVGQQPSAWSPLLISNIPTFLWWRAPLPAMASELLTQFEDHIDRLLVDSRYGGHVKEFFHTYKDITNPLPLTDFAWWRIHPLMKMTANLFNPLDFRPKLHRLTKIKLTGGDGAEGLLYFLWFSGRMDWEGNFKDSNSPWSGVNTSKEPVTFIHEPQKDLEEGFSIVFTTSSGEKFEIKSQGEGFAVCTPGSSPGYSSVFNIPSLGDSLIKEVDVYGVDRVFMDSLIPLT